MIGNILKFLRRKVISVWYMNYLTAGFQSISILPNYLIFLTFITVYIGKDNPYYLYVVISSVIIATVILTLLGSFLYSKKGTRFISSMANWKADTHTYFNYALFKQIKDISEREGIELDEDFKISFEFFETYAKEFDGGKHIKEDIIEHKKNLI